MNPNMANREVLDLEFYNYSDKKHFLTLDFANVTTTDLSANRTNAKGGKGAPERVSFDGERKGTLKIESQITPIKLYAMLAGTSITTTAIRTVTETLTAATNTLTLTETPLWPASVAVFNATTGAEVTPVSISDKTVTLPADSTGSFKVKYVVSQTKESGIQTVKFTRTSFPKAFFITGITEDKTEDDEIVAVALTYYKAVPQSTFTLTNQNSGDPMTLTITCDLLFDKDGNQVDMSVIEDEA